MKIVLAIVAILAFLYDVQGEDKQLEDLVNEVKDASADVQTAVPSTQRETDNDIMAEKGKEVENDDGDVDIRKDKDEDKEFLQEEIDDILNDVGRSDVWGSWVRRRRRHRKEDVDDVHDSTSLTETTMYDVVRTTRSIAMDDER